MVSLPVSQVVAGHRPSHSTWERRDSILGGAPDTAAAEFEGAETVKAACQIRRQLLSLE